MRLRRLGECFKVFLLPLLEDGAELVALPADPRFIFRPDFVLGLQVTSKRCGGLHSLSSLSCFRFESACPDA